ncbi:hypothetical protein GCM10011586_13760 [Silvibacterium dinghuense]|nr:hypothetical protein GCM10011586_13760 [Silvibacterium dinghuense]
MNTNSECVYFICTYSECVVTERSSRHAMLEARALVGEHGVTGFRCVYPTYVVCRGHLPLAVTTLT